MPRKQSARGEDGKKETTSVGKRGENVKVKCNFQVAVLKKHSTTTTSG